MSAIHQRQFLLTSVVATAPGMLSLSFADGFDGVVDLSGSIGRVRALARLERWAVFRDVALDEWSRGVVFNGDDDLSLASDNLRAKAIEQAGDYSHQQVIAWMERHGLTLDQAAAELGLSRRMLAYYRSGEKPVPRTVGLAMLGWEAMQPARSKGARLERQAPSRRVHESSGG